MKKQQQKHDRINSPFVQNIVPGFFVAILIVSSAWFTIGMSAQPGLVKDIFPGASDANPSFLTPMNGSLYFSATDSELGPHGTELWKSDGTAAGTVMVKDINPDTDPEELCGSSPSGLINANGTLFFVIGGGYLWKSNGTDAGTTQVSSTPSNISFTPPIDAAAVNNMVFFTRYRYIGTSQWELWRSDGTPTGTIKLKDFPGVGVENLPLLYLKGVNSTNTLFFVAYDTSSGTELWKSDGTPAGTVLVKDIYPGSAGSVPKFLINANGTLYFTASDGPSYTDTHLWKSDGTAAGTVIMPGAQYATPLADVNGVLFFSNSDTAHGNELWKTDGTSTGTVLVKDMTPGTESSFFGDCEYAHQCAVVNNTFFFEANANGYGGELWKSDGTDAGTVLVKDINPGANTSFIDEVTNVNGTLFFIADDGSHGFELWQSDGTTAGTALTTDFTPGITGTGYYGLTGVNGALFFSVDDVTHGWELWKLVATTQSANSFILWTK